MSQQNEVEWPSEEEDSAVGRRPAMTRGLQWRVARSAALVFLGIALSVGAALFLVRSSEPSAAAMSIELDGPHEAVGTERNDPDALDDADHPDRAAADGATVPSAASALPPPGRAGEGHDEVTRTLWVFVTGAVAVPGVVEIDADARLADVLEAAGGALPEADLERVNLAARPTDGQHLHLLAVGEEAPAVPGGLQNPTPPGTPAEAGGGDRPAGADLPTGTGPIDINAATLTEIETLPRVGPVLGQRILDWRTEHGPFLQASDIDAVPGIGPALLERILPLIVVQ
ncbi:ComEA family DNA-binding protein [Arthrobacter sp. Leaf234]|uniref:ComEA family DNA-binding protein n=1 Tax=Arthrobacter sp. Leaf234 TaxID=1736303 RepID=UPI00138F303D|nr:ComEA family DNA-binding protein [Arthrobacter sp. Leaf234]